MSQFLGRWAYRLYLGLGGLLVTIVVLFTLFPQINPGFHTALFVLQALNTSVKPQPWFTPTPKRAEITYPRPDGRGEADIYYVPDGKRRAALLVFLGANAAGRDDPDVVNFGNALSRAGFTAMFTWSPTMGQQNNVDPAEVENLVWAFQHLRGQDYVDPNRVGMAGFSVGGSFVMVAAAHPQIREQVAFVNSFGAYYDARDLFIQIASNAKFVGRQSGGAGESSATESRPTEPWAVDALTRRVFVNELIELVEDPAERELLTRRFGAEASVSTAARDGGESDWANLSATAETVRRLLQGTTPAGAEELLDRLPADFRQKLRDISPSHRLDETPTRLLIMHDVGDSLIPVGESRRLARDLRAAGRNNLRYTETAIFDHVRPGQAANWWELAKGAATLYRHVYGIIRVAAQPSLRP